MSLGRVVMYLHNEAPSAAGASATFTATEAGSGWNTGADYDFLVVAWYTASEENINNAGVINTGFAESLV